MNIENMIYEIRGKQVMLDRDLARLYECKNGTKEINQAVKNNMEKFPERYSWKLTEEELKYLRSKFLTTNYSNMSRNMPRVFAEQGVAMLSSVLHTETAIATSIKIIKEMKGKYFHFLFILVIIIMYSYKDVVFMDLEFSSLKDLYLRVEPALTSKKTELDRIGLSYIDKKDIWDYLVENKWKMGIDLTLSDVVDDILNTDNNLIDKYFKEKNTSLDDNN